MWIVFGVMADKQFTEMIFVLKPYARQFVFTKPQSSRAKDPVELQQLVTGSHVEESVLGAIKYAQERAPLNATILICGSLYLVGEALSLWERVG